MRLLHVVEREHTVDADCQRSAVAGVTDVGLGGGEAIWEFNEFEKVDERHRADSRSFSAFGEDVRTVLQSTWGRTEFDHLVNNVGYGLYNPIATVTEAQFDGLFNVHLKGPFFLTQTLLPLISDGGHIVNTTSATTRIATAGSAPIPSPREPSAPNSAPHGRSRSP